VALRLYSRLMVEDCPAQHPCNLPLARTPGAHRSQRVTFVLGKLATFHACNLESWRIKGRKQYGLLITAGYQSTDVALQTGIREA
jgi:hypothetical protein